MNGRKSVESRNQFPKVYPLACGLGMLVGARQARKTILGKQALANFSATLGISLTFLDVFQKSFGRNAEHRGEGKAILRDKGRNIFRPLGPFIHSSIHPFTVPTHDHSLVQQALFTRLLGCEDSENKIQSLP